MSDSTRSQNEYDHCSMLTTVAINVVYILSFILKYVALQVLVQEVLSLNIIISPQDGDSGHKNFDHYCTYFSTQKWKFYIIILPKVNRRVVKLQAHWHWTQTKSTVTMSVMNWCTALMCNEIWWTMIDPSNGGNQFRGEAWSLLALDLSSKCVSINWRQSTGSVPCGHWRSVWPLTHAAGGMWKEWPYPIGGFGIDHAFTGSWQPRS